jgi:DNA-binding CsgD family transcriptional regulator
VILEDAARSASLRGAPTGAAELAEQALRLTPAARHDDALRRLLFAAELQNRAGDAPRAIGLLERALAAAAPGDERATVLRQLAVIHTSPLVSIPLYHGALEEAHDDALRAIICCDLALAMRWGEGIERAVEHAEDAVRAASRTADAAVRCRALAVYGSTHLFSGRGMATAPMEEAIALERSLAEWPLDGGPAYEYGMQLFWAADVERGRAHLGELESAAKEQNDPMGEAQALWLLGFLEWRAGAWEEADLHVAGSLSLSRQLGAVMPPSEFPAAVIAAHRGRIDEARATARGAVARGETERIRIAESGHSWVLGFIELSLGDAAAALVHLRRSYEIRNDFMLEPAQRLELGDYLEALIAVGELEEADEVIDTWEKRATRLDRAWALAILARGGGLLRGARGDLEGAFARFERALAEHERSTDPFHYARTLLALGRTQRRAKKRRAARATLDDALAEFARLGAPLWAEQARTELARIGGRAASRRELTEAERRIADLVAQGRTNREVAAALFLTVHSVETALTRVYRKLGVRSRAELARYFAAKS